MMGSSRRAIIVLLVCYLLAISAIFVQAGPIDNAIDDNEITFLSSALSKCTEIKGITAVVTCATMRAIKSIQTISKQPVIKILPGVTFSSDPKNIARAGKEILHDGLPTDPKERMYALFDMLVETTVRLFSGRTLKLELTTDTKENVARALEEGRGKMKKMMMPMLMSIGSKMITIIPVAVGAVALLTTKALVVAKVALVVAVIAFFSSLNGGGGFRMPSLGSIGAWTTNSIGHDYQPYGTSYQHGTYPTNMLGAPYRRSIDVSAGESAAAKDLKTAQENAYWSQKQ